MNRPGSIAWNARWFALGACLGVANTLRHRLVGYRRPRPFGREDLDRTIAHVLGVVERWRDHGLDPRDQRILELGPGPDLGTGFALVALGAMSYTAVDRFPLASHDDGPLYAALAERLGVDRAATLKRMEYRVGATTLEGVNGPRFDAFVSNAVLEHVADVAATFSGMVALGAEGAIHVHLVDAQTHMRWVRPRDPWNILRYPDWMYRAMTFPGAPNRLLPSDYVAAGKRAGLALSTVAVDRAPDEYLRRIQPSLASPFRGRPHGDLAVLTFIVVGGTVMAHANHGER